MFIHFKYFFENSDSDYAEYAQLWDDNCHRMVYIQPGLPLFKQLVAIEKDLTNPDKDILSIRFPSYNNNKLIKSITNGNGIQYKGVTWFPKEVWIYNPR